MKNKIQILFITAWIIFSIVWLYFSIVWLCSINSENGKCLKCSKYDKYTLIQSDSPNLPNYHPEIDLISNDTIYVNWYSNHKK